MLEATSASVQTASTRSNIFENKGNVEAMFNETLNQFQVVSKRFLQAFKTFSNDG